MSYLAAGASTQSRARRPLPEGWDPVVVDRSGAEETWANPAHKISCTWALDQGGPIFGYTMSGDTFARMLGPGSIVSEDEILAAQILVETVGPFLAGEDHVVRFFANGSDACDCAIRLARYATGRDRFLSYGYHGSSVIFAHPPQNGGVPSVIHWHTDIEFGYPLTRDDMPGSPAAIIVEVPSDDERAREYLASCREMCDLTGAVLILDELVTGFRLALGGAAEYYGVKPDLACYGKALANGRPIAALVGSRKLMEPLEDRVFYSNTYNGDPFNCAHLIATLNRLTTGKDTIYPYIWGIGNQLRQAMLDVGITLSGHAPRTYINMPEEERRKFCAEMVRRGIVMDRPNYATLAHTEKHVELTRRAAETVLG